MGSDVLRMALPELFPGVVLVGDEALRPLGHIAEALWSEGRQAPFVRGRYPLSVCLRERLYAGKRNADDRDMRNLRRERNARAHPAKRIVTPPPLVLLRQRFQEREVLRVR